MSLFKYGFKTQAKQPQKEYTGASGTGEKKEEVKCSTITMDAA